MFAVHLELFFTLSQSAPFTYAVYRPAPQIRPNLTIDKKQKKTTSGLKLAFKLSFGI